MKAPDFDYLRPADLGEALAVLAAHDGAALPLAGGQSLMPMLNFRVAAPEVLVDLGRIEELRGITREGGRIRIGAMTRYAELAALPGLARDMPLVAAALPHIAHDAIRNRGTVGGSLALADPAAELPAVMLALAAEIELVGPRGCRTVAADDFFLGYYETACGPAELIAAVHVPVARPDEAHGFHELVQRHGDYAMAGVALRAGQRAPLADLRVAFFGVADRALRVPALEAALVASGGDDLDAALAALAEVDFLADTKVSPETRAHYAGVALKRAWRDMA